MDVNEFKLTLSDSYRRKDAAGFIRTISDFKKQPEFQKLCLQLVKAKRISPATTSMEVIINALLVVIEQSQKMPDAHDLDGNFYDVAEYLRNHFNESLAEIFLESQMPNDFILSAREGEGSGERIKLTKALIEQHKNELMRLDIGHAEVVKTLQSCTNFPIDGCINVAKVLDELVVRLKSNHKYITVKPLIQSILEIGGDNIYGNDRSDPESAKFRKTSLFKSYIETGEEPSFSQQIAFHMAVKRLFSFIKKNALLSEGDYSRFWSPVFRFLSYKGKRRMDGRAKPILNELLVQLNVDRAALLEKLYLTFLDEYRCAEELMLVRYRMIETELLYTREYLDRLKLDSKSSAQKDEKKVKLALEKVFFLQDIFTIPEWKVESVRTAGLTELERSAFGVSTEISPKHLTEWIRIYSILFSNSDLLEYSDKEINFLLMRQLISHLTTYYLIQNVTQLKRMIDKVLTSQPGDAVDRIRLFNDALKVKLHGLLDPSGDDKSFQEMIDELGFINDKKAQFLIADTFSGFQVVADAFNTSANDYFVKDKNALLKESHALYNDICNQCLKGLVARPKKPKSSTDNSKNVSKPWFSRVFAS